ncbi:MAG: PAS domain-containing protein [Chloroflexota bacterium]|nr:PAS domain-containing protein [Chloroflexota bacterium]
MGTPRRRRPHGAITARQAEVVGLVARGYTNKEIGAALGITESGVSAHVSRLFTKLRVANRAELIGRIMADAGFSLAPHDRPSQSRLALQAHLALASPKDEFEIYRRAPFLVTITEGPQHRYRFVNDAALRVVGMSEKRMLGRPAHDVFKRERSWLALWNKALRSAKPTYANDMRARWTDAAGLRREATFDYVYLPLARSEGRVVGLLHIGTTTD